MGYYVRSIDTNFIIPADKIDAAYQAACALNAQESNKTGGRAPYTGTKPADSRSVAATEDRWFAYVPWNYDEICSDLTEILTVFGFNDSGIDPTSGNLVVGDYAQSSGGEHHLFLALAPYATEGSYVHFHGEDDSFYGYRVACNGCLHAIEGTLVWRDVE